MPQYFIPKSKVAENVQRFISKQINETGNTNVNIIYNITIINKNTACYIPSEKSFSITQVKNIDHIKEGLYYYNKKFYVIFPDEDTIDKIKKELYINLTRCFPKVSTENIEENKIKSLFIMKLEDTDDLTKSEINKSFIETYSVVGSTEYTNLCQTIKKYLEITTCPQEILRKDLFKTYPPGSDKTLIHNTNILCKILEKQISRIQEICDKEKSEKRAEELRRRAAELKLKAQEEEEQAKNDKMKAEKALEEQAKIERLKTEQAKNEQIKAEQKTIRVEQAKSQLSKQSEKIYTKEQQFKIEDDDNTNIPKIYQPPECAMSSPLVAQSSIPQPISLQSAFVIIKKGKTNPKAENDKLVYEVSDMSEIYVYNFNDQSEQIVDSQQLSITGKPRLYEINHKLAPYYIVEFPRNNSIISHPKTFTLRIIEDASKAGLSEFLECYNTNSPPPEKCQPKSGLLGLFGKNTGTSYFEGKYSFQSFVGVPYTISMKNNIAYLVDTTLIFFGEDKKQLLVADNVFFASGYILIQPKDASFYDTRIENIEYIYIMNGKKTYDQLYDFKLPPNTNSTLKPFYMKGNNIYHIIKTSGDKDKDKKLYNFKQLFSLLLYLLKVYNVDVSEMWRNNSEQPTIGGHILSKLFYKYCKNYT